MSDLSLTLKDASKSIILILLVLSMFSTYSLTQSRPRTVIVHINREIGEGTAYMVERGVGLAQGGVLILVIDSYGGYVHSMDKIVSTLMTCNCKTISWIPPGGKAVSAAALIALSTDKLYVGEGAVLGACKPYPPDEKVEAYIYSKVKALLKEKGVEDSSGLARRIVYENYLLDYNEVLEKGIGSGEAETLDEVFSKENISKTPTLRIERDLTAELLDLLFDPGLALMFIILGVLLILLEIKATGFQGWGILGGFLLAVSFYTFNLIGINLLTLTLIALGLFSLILELKKPGIQVFGIAGLTLLVLAILLEYYTRPYVSLSLNVLPILAGFGAFAALIFVIISKAAGTLKLGTPTLENKLIGKVGYAKTDIRPGSTGVAYVEGEDWSAYSDKEVKKGEKIIVKKVEGLRLYVEPVKGEPK